MLIQVGVGEFVCGPLDVIMILRHNHTGRFHVSFVVERFAPGPVKETLETEVVPMRADMTHTLGFATFEEAQAEVDAMRSKITIRDENVVRNGYYDWDGIPVAMLANNWLRNNTTFEKLYPPHPPSAATATPFPAPDLPVTADSLLAAGGLPLG